MKSLRFRRIGRVAVCTAAFLGGCDSGSPAAPTQTVLGVAANPATITLNQSSELTVTGSGPFGNALTPGTQLVLSTTLGRLSQENVTADASGGASAILTAEGQIGTATVTVAFEGGRSPQSASVDVEITAVPGATTAGNSGQAIAQLLVLPAPAPPPS